MTQAKVNTYNGNRNPETIEKFIGDVKWVSEGFNLSDSQLIIVAGKNMTGAADKWYIKYKNTEEHNTDSFKTFLNKLKGTIF